MLFSLINAIFSDLNGEPRRTLLHSKLSTRVFPSVARIIQDLTEALNTPVELQGGEEPVEADDDL